MARKPKPRKQRETLRDEKREFEKNSRESEKVVESMRKREEREFCFF